MNQGNLVIWVGGTKPPEGTPFAEGIDNKGNPYYITANPGSTLWAEFVLRLKQEDDEASKFTPQERTADMLRTITDLKDWLSNGQLEVGMVQLFRHLEKLIKEQDGVIDNLEKQILSNTLLYKIGNDMGQNLTELRREYRGEMTLNDSQQVCLRQLVRDYEKFVGIHQKDWPERTMEFQQVLWYLRELLSKKQDEMSKEVREQCSKELK